MSFSTTDQLGLAFRFDVVIDGFNLGSWSSCKGLGVTFKHEKITELGQHAYTTNIPGRADYTQITLQRAIKAGDWKTTKAWLEQVTGDAWLTGSSRQSSATIILRDAKLEKVESWTLKNAMPVSWKGPQLDASGKTVATETLDLVHEGFLDD